MTITLRPHQKGMVRFLTEVNPAFPKPHRCLAGSPGTGKTYATCEALIVIKARRVMLFCPPTIKLDWAKNLIEYGTFKADEIFICWTRKDKIPPTAKCVISNVHLIHSTIAVPKKKGTPKYVKAKRKQNPLFKQFYDKSWDAVVVDEAQCLRSISSTVTFTLLKRNGYPLIGRAHHKWFLSGSFLMNKAADLFPLARALGRELIEPYDTWEEYGMRFCNGYYDMEAGGYNFNGFSNIKDLTRRLSPLFYFVYLDDIWKDMPPVTYEEVLMKLGRQEVTQRNSHIATVRKAVGMQKIRFIANWIKERLEGNDTKIVLCATHREVIEAYEKLLAKFHPRKIYGGMRPKQKVQAMDDFVHGKSRLFILNAQSAGEGVDRLQLGSSTLVWGENEWSDGMWNQVIGRLKRFGQTRPMLFVHFKAVKTLDEHIVRKQQHKRKHIVMFEQPQRKKSIMEQGVLERIAIALETLAGKSTVTGGASAASESKAEGSKSSTSAKSADAGKSSEKSATGDKKAAASKTGTAPAKGAAKTAGTKGQGMSREELDKVIIRTAKTLQKEFDYDKAEAQEKIKEVIEDLGFDELDDVPQAKYKKLAAAIESLLEEDDEDGDDEDGDED